jgi:hypothetical protein
MPHGLNTLILRPDGTSTYIEDLDVGDKVMGLDVDNKTMITTIKSIVIVKEDTYAVHQSHGDTIVLGSSHLLSVTELMNVQDLRISISVEDFMGRDKQFRREYGTYRPREIRYFTDRCIRIYDGSLWKGTTSIPKSILFGEISIRKRWIAQYLEKNAIYKEYVAQKKLNCGGWILELLSMPYQQGLYDIVRSVGLTIIPLDEDRQFVYGNALRTFPFKNRILPNIYGSSADRTSDVYDCRSSLKFSYCGLSKCISIETTCGRYLLRDFTVCEDGC